MTQFLVLIITIITAMACALIGNFLVLKRMSLMGDAISHAVLPGIVIAFFISGTLESPLFFLFAVIFAVMMAGAIQWITDRVRVSRESVIGIVFTFLFALGVVLLVRYAGNVHLDQDAVLYGSVEFSAWNKFVVAGVDIGPRALWEMGLVLLVNSLLVGAFWKELKITTFDPVMAESVGISVKKMHYLLMSMTAVTVVAAFEVVGAILVVALLVVPAVTAYLLSEKLFVMILWSMVFALMASVGGYLFAVAVDGSIAGAVASAAGLILMIVFIGLKMSLWLKRSNYTSKL